MLGLLNTVLTRGGSLLTYVKEGLVMANRFLTPPKLTFPVNGSAEFDGASDYISITSNDSISGITEDFTLSFWLYRNSGTAHISKGDSDITEEFRVQLTDGYVYFDVGNNTGPYKQPSTTNATSEWIHYAFTSKRTSGNTDIQIYKDGSNLGGSVINPGNSHNTNTHPIFIGRYLTNYTNGNFANVAIWNRALSSDEINSVMWKSYEKLTTTESNGLQAWYKLEESELFDASNTSTTNLEEYAKLNSVTFEGKACLQTALNAFPDITDARLYSGRYDARVSGDGGTVEALNCVETELNALL